MCEVFFFFGSLGYVGKDHQEQVHQELRLYVPLRAAMGRVRGHHDLGAGPHGRVGFRRRASQVELVRAGGAV